MLSGLLIPTNGSREFTSVLGLTLVIGAESMDQSLVMDVRNQSR
jgi:hypothetical protein